MTIHLEFFRVNVSITKANKNGPRDDSWCNPIKTEKCSESPLTVFYLRLWLDHRCPWLLSCITGTPSGPFPRIIQIRGLFWWQLKPSNWLSAHQIWCWPCWNSRCRYFIFSCCYLWRFYHLCHISAVFGGFFVRGFCLSVSARDGILRSVSLIINKLLGNNSPYPL